MGQALINTSSIGPPDGQGLLKTLVPGTPDCRAEPVGDGLVGVDGQNCPFQMYTLSGSFRISQGGVYTFCSTSEDGYKFNFHSLHNEQEFYMFCRSKVYVDGQVIIDNDGSVQLLTTRCTRTFARIGIHILQIEGWTSSASWSMAVTYSGPDTLNLTLPIPPSLNLGAPSRIVPEIKDCSPKESVANDGQFVICGFKAGNNLNLRKVDDFVTNYLNVSYSVQMCILA